MSSLTNLYGAQTVKRQILPSASTPILGQPLLSDDLGLKINTISYSRQLTSVSAGGGKILMGGEGAADPVDDCYVNYYNGTSWNGNWTLDDSSAWRFSIFGNGIHMITNTVSAYVGVLASNGNFYLYEPPTRMVTLSFANGYFIAIGNNNRLYTSTDGQTWTDRAYMATQFKSTVYAEGLYVSVGSNNNVYTSPDLTTWTARSLSILGNFNAQSIAYGNGRYVVVGDYYGTSISACGYSEDGITWSMGVMPEGRSWYSIAFGNGGFITVGSNGTNIGQLTYTVAISADGSNWAKKTLKNRGAFSGISYDSTTNKFIVVQTHQASTDGSEAVLGSNILEIDANAYEIAFEK